MKKRLLAIMVSILAFSAFLLTAFAVESLSSEDVIAQKRAWYPTIRTGEEKLHEEAISKSLGNIEVDHIVVTSYKYLKTEDEVKAEATKNVFISTISIYFHFTATCQDNSLGYVFCYRPQINDTGLYRDSSHDLDVSNYNDNISFLSGNYNLTRLGDNYRYGSAFGSAYYIGFDLADYQNYVSTSAASTSTAPTPTQVETSEPKPEPVEKYTKNQELVISGKTDFNYFYTYKDGLKYKCFSLTKNGERFYASVREDLYDYYKNAFQNHSLTLKGNYKFTAEDGSPVVSVSTLVEGTKETNLRSYLWTVNKGSVKNPNFKAYADLKGDGLVLSAAEDGKSITIDSNPWGAAKGSQAYKLDNDFALLMIKELNSELGLPDWLYTEMMGTRALDGRQKEVFDYVTVIWSYHPDSGINILYRKNN